MVRPFKRQYIYDFAQRVLHWWIALSVILLIITGYTASNMEADSSRAFLWGWHMEIGKWLLVGLVGRLIWAILGPEHARVNALLHPHAWLESVKTRKMLSADAEFGHHAQASISYIGFYALMAVMTGTGLLLAAIIHGEGPLAERFLDGFQYLSIIHTVHEYGWWAVAFFVVTHIGALIFHEWYDRIPIAQSMISGFQYRTEKEKKIATK